MKRTLCPVLVGLLAGSLIAGAHAHHPWVLTDAGQIERGDRAVVLPFFGHEFPADAAMDADRIDELIVLDANGHRITLDSTAAEGSNTPVLDEPGVHVIGLRQVRGYWSQTTEGGRPLPRAELDNAVSCGYSDNGAKTLLIVGEGGPSAAAQALGHRLEILLDANVRELAEGDSARFRVLLEGRPHAGPVLAFHADSGEDPYRVTETDRDGQAKIVLEGSGPWMLLALGEIDYPDPAVCDQERFHASLTFGQPGSH